MPTMLHVPEMPIAETWQWQTDVMVSDNGTEQRVDLCEFPKRSFALRLEFDDIADVRAELLLMMQMGSAYDLALFQYQTRLKANAADDATVLSILANRTELRVGEKCYVFDRTGGEIHTVEALTDTTVTLTVGLTRPYSTRASICPVVSVYSAGNGGMDRLNPDYAARAELTAREVAFTAPFLHEFNEQVLPDLNGLPILEPRPIGHDFADGVDTGIEVFDTGGVVDIRNPWTHAQQTLQRRFQSNRSFDFDDWDLWRVFADYAKGSCNPFYVPTYRQDFELDTAPDPGDDTFKWVGSSYRVNYFPYEAFKAVAIYSDAGVHYAVVTNATASGPDTNVTFDPPLPEDEGWDSNVSVTMLIKCRIAGDRVSCYHYALHSEVELSLRTVDN